MISLFRRDKEAASPEEELEDVQEQMPKGYTPPKGQETPRRKRANAPVEPPATNKEARLRMKERAKAERAAQYEGAKKGDERYMFARDQGPVRRLVRDIVDSRRNMGTYFFFGTFVVVIGSLQFMPSNVRYVTTMIWIALVALFIIDAVFLTLKLRRTIKERHPGTKKMVGHCFYGVMRSVVFRRMRSPEPMVKIGEPY
ncbi:MAG: DUF3043 domain-containing protein [Corynebacteriales bacterium]|nr:DUF3043 domain-containing protein [Mycobacteriales bacterium]